MKLADQIKPCPFCLHPFPIHFVDGDDTTTIQCAIDDCSTMIKSRGGLEAAVPAWNAIEFMAMSAQGYVPYYSEDEKAAILADWRKKIEDWYNRLR